MEGLEECWMLVARLRLVNFLGSNGLEVQVKVREHDASKRILPCAYMSVILKFGRPIGDPAVPQQNAALLKKETLPPPPASSILPQPMRRNQQGRREHRPEIKVGRGGGQGGGGG